MDNINMKAPEKSLIGKLILPIILVVILGVIGTVLFGWAGLSSREIKERTEDYINSELMLPGTVARVTNVEKKFGLYKVKVDIGTDIIESYVTRDAKIFFPQAYLMDEVGPFGAEGDGGPLPTLDLPKSDKPEIELFVMSHCPYGTQMEKGILPVVDLLGDKIDFNIKFVNYAMHGEKEVDEQIKQHCINTEQNEEYLPYLKCFLTAGDTEACLGESSIDTTKLNTCIEETDAQYKITENFKNGVNFSGSYPSFPIYDAENQAYNVAGSPTLIINGVEAMTDRSPQALLNTICGAFNEQPAECDEILSTDTPAPGFGTGVAVGPSSNAECF